MDDVELKQLCKQYGSSMDGDVVRFFERPTKNGYVVLGDSLDFILSTFFQNQVPSIKYIEEGRPHQGSSNADKRMGILTLSSTQAESIWSECLLTHLKRIEIWGQQEKSKTWNVTRQASPGNLLQLDDLILNDQTGLWSCPPLSLGICINEVNPVKNVYVGYVDTFRSTIGISHFVDNEQFSNLESLVVQMNVKEMVVFLAPGIFGSMSAGTAKGLKQSLFYWDVKYSESRDHLDISLEMIESQLGSVLYDKAGLGLIVRSMNEESMNRHTSIRVLFSLCQQMGLLRAEKTDNKFYFKTYNLAQYMRLDSAVLRALSIFDGVDGNAGGTVPVPVPISGMAIRKKDNERSNSTSDTNNGGSGSGSGSINMGRIGGSNGSLFGLISGYLKTNQGKRLLSQWLRQPLLDLKEIRQRQDMVELWITQFPSLLRDIRQDVLGKCSDLTRLSIKVQLGKASLQDLIRIYQVVLLLSKLHNSLLAMSETEAGTWIGSGSGSESLLGKEPAKLIQGRYLGKLGNLAHELDRYLDLIEATIDLPATENHEYLIQAHFDPVLAELQEKRDFLLENKINPEWTKVSQLFGLEKNKKLKLERNDIHGYFLRMSRLDIHLLNEHKNKSHSKKQNLALEELSTQKNGIHFTTGLLKEASQEYEDLSREYVKRQSSLVKEIVAVAGSYVPLFLTYNALIADVDVLGGFAMLASLSLKSYCKPVFSFHPENERSCLTIVNGRHPLVEQQLQLLQKDFIPNDTLLYGQSGDKPELDQEEEQDKDQDQAERGTEREIRNKDEASFLVITGPNMGGKSTYLRQVGLMVLLAQIGSWVPADKLEMKGSDAEKKEASALIDGLFARVGASDSPLKGISTFMAEMMEMAVILNSATRNSLVLIDELGRGTCSSDGLALAWSISCLLLEKVQCKTLFATHFHELTNLLPTSISNLCVATASSSAAATATATTTDARQDPSLLLYKVLPGTGDQSFGLQVAKAVFFPNHVIHLALLKSLLLLGNQNQSDPCLSVSSSPSPSPSPSPSTLNLLSALTAQPSFLSTARFLLEQLNCPSNTTTNIRTALSLLTCPSYSHFYGQLQSLFEIA